MKKKSCACLVLLLVLAFLMGCAGTEEKTGIEKETGIEEETGTEMDAANSRLELTEHGVVEYLSVITYSTEIEDMETCAEEIIERSIANDFKNILFSYDRNGYPIELHAKVYLTEKDMENGNPVFEMDYEQDKEDGYRYNIKDHPEKFHLTIR